ncbi:MAG: transposase, partial [Anaerolineae bacterium]
MKAKRYFAEIGREAGIPGENIQHFVSNSPWSARPIYRQIQEEIAAIPALHGGALLVDDSADAKSGPHSAGASRQYNGRLGKVDLCQSGVFLAYFKDHTWTWVDAELYLPEEWFAPERAADREKAGIPPERVFQTKPELAQEMIARARQNGLPFSFVACDELYGRKDAFRSWMAREGILYLADVPASTLVYLERPHWGIPEGQRRSRKPPRPRVLSPSQPVTVRQVAQD